MSSIRFLKEVSLPYNNATQCGDGCCTFPNWQNETFPAGDELDADLEGSQFELDGLTEGVDFVRVEDDEDPKTPQEIIAEVAEEIGEGVTDDYSGRGMMGEKCLAIACPMPEIVIRGAIARGLTGHRQDSLGHGSIVYWPQVQAELQPQSQPQP
jgi:hypothetical protein